MAARTVRIRQTEDTRAKIQAAYFINRLTSHIKGDIDLSSSQIQAIKILLDKSLPNLSDVRIDAGAQGVTFNLNTNMPVLPARADSNVIDVEEINRLNTQAIAAPQEAA